MELRPSHFNPESGRKALESERRKSNDGFEGTEKLPAIYQKKDTKWIEGDQKPSELP